MSEQVTDVFGEEESNDDFLEPGAIIDERYEVISILSKGDGRAVYLVQMLAGDNKQLAMKVMHKPRPGEDFPTTAKRFRTELVAAYRISHENVVNVYEFIELPNLLAYTMEYIDGGNLQELLAEDSEISAERVLNLLSQICAGLQAIHESGIIHREIKPRNILLDENGIVKITDFGVARVEDHQNLTMHGGLVGTMDYLSPEYITEGKLDKRLDIYSVGVLGYKMLTGEVPFQSDDMMKTLTQRLSETPEHPIHVNSECSVEMGDVILKALERDPEDRFETAQEMQIAFDELLYPGQLDQEEEQEELEESSQEDPDTDSMLESSSEQEEERVSRRERESTLRAELLDSFDNDLDLPDSFSEAASDFDPLEMEDESPTASHLHRAVNARATSRLSKRRMFLVAIFVAAIGSGVLFNVAQQGKQEDPTETVVTEEVVADSQKVETPETQVKETGEKETAPIVESKPIDDAVPKPVVDTKTVASTTRTTSEKSEGLSAKQEEGAISEYKLLLGLNPGDPKVNYNLGLLYVGRGEYQMAEKYLEEAVRLDPTNTTANYYLKKVRRKLSRRN